MKPLRYAVSAGVGACAEAGAAASPAAAAAKPAACTKTNTANRLHRMERLFEIRNQIVGVFDANRNPDQRIGDPDAVASFLGQAGMRGAGGMGNQSLGSAEAHRQFNDLQSIQQTERFGLSAVNREAEGRARAAALPVENRPSRIVRAEKAEVIHIRDLRVRTQ